MSIFRNPQKPVALELDGINQGPSNGISPASVMLRLNGQTLGEFNTRGAFRQTYLLSEDILRTSGWGDVEIIVSRTFSTK